MNCWEYGEYELDLVSRKDGRLCRRLSLERDGEQMQCSCSSSRVLEADVAVQQSVPWWSRTMQGGDRIS